MKAAPSASFYFRTPSGKFGFARWIKSRRRFALEHLIPSGEQLVSGRRYRPDASIFRRVRVLKSRPSRARIRAAGW